MRQLSLYQENKTLIHRMDPITKMVYILAACSIPFILPSMAVGLICLSVSIVLLSVGKVLRKVIPIIGLSGVLLATTVLIQGFFYAGNETELFRVMGLGFYQEGLLFSIGICIRVINILCAFSILVLSTKPSDLVEALVRRGLSPRLGYVLTSVLQIIPQMVSTMETITDAQRSRGMETEGNLMVRFKAFLPLIGPVVMNALSSTRERSMALEVRGFNAKATKTFLNEEHKWFLDMPVRWTLLTLIAMALVWRVVG